MINFEDIEELVNYMFENCEEQTVSVVANKDIAIDILKELLCYEDTEVDVCELDNNEEYNREYAVVLCKDPDVDKWTFGVEKAYLEDQNKYLSTGDYVLFHEDVNSKALIDAQNNEYLPIGEHEWFTIGEDKLEGEDTDGDDSMEETDLDNDSNENKESDDSRYSVTVKVGLDTNEAEKMIRDMEDNFRKRMYSIFDMLYRQYSYEYLPSPLRIFW